jgi:phosphoribosylanthranilate isomerase
MNNTPVPFVKVCGLTTLGHMRAAEMLGARYVGLIVEVARSPRSLSRDQARLLARAARAQAVLVTTATELASVVELARFVQPDVVQLHGSGGARLTSDARSALPDTELWHVVPLDVEPEDAAVEPTRLRAEVEAAIAAGADKLLIDSARGGRAGGTGVTAERNAGHPGWRTQCRKCH